MQALGRVAGEIASGVVCVVALYGVGVRGGKAVRSGRQPVAVEEELEPPFEARGAVPVDPGELPGL